MKRNYTKQQQDIIKFYETNSVNFDEEQDEPTEACGYDAVLDQKLN